MLSRTAIFRFLLLSSIPASASFAQDLTGPASYKTKLSIGIVGGINEIVYKTDVFQTPGLPAGTAVQGDGSGYDARLGISFDWSLDEGSQHFITCDVVYNGQFARFSNDISYLSNSDHATLPILSAVIRTVQVDLDYRLNVIPCPDPSALGFSLGPSVSTVVGTPLFITSRSGALHTTLVSNYNRLILGWNLRASYDIPFSNQAYFTLLAGIDGPLTRFSDAYNWDIVGLFGAFAVRYRLPSGNS